MMGIGVPTFLGEKIEGRKVQSLPFLFSRKMISYAFKIPGFCPYEVIHFKDFLSEISGTCYGFLTPILVEAHKSQEGTVITNINKRLYVSLSFIPYFVGSWIIYYELGKMIAVAISLMILGAMFAFYTDLMSRNKQNVKDSDKE